MSDTEKKLTARQRARMAQAAQLEAQRKRAGENLKDLEKYFTAAEKLNAVEEKYAADLKKLDDTYESDKRGHEDAIGAALAGLRGRGETTAAIAQQTGLSAAQVSAAIKKIEGEAEEAKEEAAGADGVSERTESTESVVSGTAAGEAVELLDESLVEATA
ncbi:hypothetical protein [Mycobacteroides chelonae]|uniref:hypothetical protein n=1 Tax=Mycobacteroides chelonae TaxID=1774 RepID=UPI0009924D1C|nr:hypothetical protein [Mycobacteroides chelonae]